MDKYTEKRKNPAKKRTEFCQGEQKTCSKIEVLCQTSGVLILQGVTPTKNWKEKALKDPKSKSRGVPHFTGGSFPDFTSCRPPGGRGLGSVSLTPWCTILQGGIQNFLRLSGFPQGVTPQKVKTLHTKKLFAGGDTNTKNR